MPCRDLSINDLVELSNNGIPVAMTSHPGNASLYKLTLWSSGIQERLWDVTCAKADKNNWPRHVLSLGRAIPLLSDDRMKEVEENTSAHHRYVTAYLKTVTGQASDLSCGRVHVRAMEKLFPSVISSYTKLLLEHKEQVLEVFAYLAETRCQEVFTRQISPEGVMTPWQDVTTRPEDVARSCMNVLEELDKLLFSDEVFVPKGGICYGGVLVPLIHMLSDYWRTGETHRYDISGPDMIHYSTRKEHQVALTKLLSHLRGLSQSVIPKNLTVHMPLGTVARVGHVAGHASEAVMRRRMVALRDSCTLDSVAKRNLKEAAMSDESLWPSQISPAATPYFSQHDLLTLGQTISVDEFWKEMPLGDMTEAFSRAKNLLSSRK